MVYETLTDVVPSPNYSLDPTFNDAEILHGVIEEHVTCWYHHWTLGGSTEPHRLRYLVYETLTDVVPSPNYSLDPTFNDAEILHGVIEEHVTCWYHHWTLGGSTEPHRLRYLVYETLTDVVPSPNYSFYPTFNDAEILHGVIEEHVTCWYHHWTLGGSTEPHRLRYLVYETLTDVVPSPNYSLDPTFNDAEILHGVIEEHVTCWYHHWTLGGSTEPHRLRYLVYETLTDVVPSPNYSLDPTFNDAEILHGVIEEHVTCWYHHWTLGGSTEPHRLRYLVYETLTDVVPSPNYSLDPTFNDAEILHGVIEEHVTCWYHHWTLGGSTEPHRLRYLVYETLTDVVPSPNYSLDPTFNDAEILHGVIEEHVTCWYHHWTLGGSTEPHRLRYLVYETLTDVVPSPNYSLDPTFNDAEILHGVIEEHVTCWYHHWALGGSTEPHRLRYLVYETLTDVVPSPNYSLDPTFNDAEILHGVIEEHVTCWYHHWALGGSTEPHRLRYLVYETLTDVVPSPNYSLDPTFNDAEILHGVIEEHVTCWYHHWTLGGSTEPHRLRYLVYETLTDVVPSPNYSLDPTFNDAEILHGVIEEHVTCWYHHWTLGGSTEPHRLRYLVYETLTDVVPSPNYSLDPTFNDAEILHGVIEEHVTCWYHHWTLGGSTEPHRLRYLVYETLTDVVPSPNYSLDPTFNDAEILHGVIEEHVTCWYHHWTLGGSTDHIGYDIWSMRPSPMWFLAQTTAWTQLSMTQKSFMG